MAAPSQKRTSDSNLSGAPGRSHRPPPNSRVKELSSVAATGQPKSGSDKRLITIGLTRADLGIMIPVLRTQPGHAGSVSTPAGAYPSARTPFVVPTHEVV